MKQFFYLLGFTLLALNLSGCAKAKDLDTPCPDFGRHCQQALINPSINATVS